MRKTQGREFRPMLISPSYGRDSEVYHPRMGDKLIGMNTRSEPAVGYAVEFIGNEKIVGIADTKDAGEATDVLVIDQNLKCIPETAG